MALVFFYATGNAQPTLTLQQAIEIAMQNNYDIMLAKNEAEIAAKNNHIGNAGMLPRVTANLGDNYTLSNLRQEFTTGQEINRNNVGGNNLSVNIALQWTLFDGLRMFATKARLARLEQIGVLQLKDQIQTSISQVMLAYYNIVRAKQQLVALQESVKVFEVREKLAEMRYQVGTSGKSELLQAKVDLNGQKSNVLMQQRLLENAKYELNTLLSRDANTLFDVNDSIEINRDLGGIDALETGNLQLQIATKQVEVAGFSKREVLSQLLPNLTGNVGYTLNFSQQDAGFLLFNQTYGLNAGFNLSIPLFNGLNNLRQLQVARLQVNSAKFSLDRSRALVKLGAYQALRNFANAKALLELEEANIQLADENQKIAAERFRQAQSSAIEFREAQRSYIESLTRLVNARYEAKIAEIEWLRLSGKLIQ